MPKSNLGPLLLHESPRLFISLLVDVPQDESAAELRELNEASNRPEFLKTKTHGNGE